MYSVLVYGFQGGSGSVQFTLTRVWGLWMGVSDSQPSSRSIFRLERLSTMTTSCLEHARKQIVVHTAVIKRRGLLYRYTGIYFREKRD